MATSQHGKLLRIETVLSKRERLKEGDPLLLTMVQGSEGISIPFSYDFTMYRDEDLDDIDPRTLINTVAKIGIRTTKQDGDTDDDVDDNLDYVFRKGVFEHFEKVSGDIRGFRVYNGRIVPAFKMLARETVFRIFEDKDVKSIIEAVLRGFPNLKFNTNLLAGERFPKLEYCVQFGESSFAFLTRLMASFGIWYVFDHDLDPESETMVLGRSKNRVSTCDVIDIVDKEPGDRTISGFMRLYDPASKRVQVGNFNLLQPMVPIEADKTIAAEFDLLPGAAGSAGGAAANPGPATRFETDIFPAPFLTNTDETDRDGPRDVPEEYVKNPMNEEEAQVFTVIGNSKDRRFRAGRTFVIHDDQTLSDKDKKAQQANPKPEEASKEYLIKFLSFVGVVSNYGRTAVTDLGDFFSDIFKSVGTGGAPDVTVSIANGLLNNYLQNEQQAAWQDIFTAGGGPPAVPFFPFVFAGGIASLAGALPSIFASVEHVSGLHASKYSNSFKAIPFNPPVFSLLPPAAGPKPVGYGPHLATVIGPNGASTPGGQEIHADALGRVRVRFPWDPGPPAAPGAPALSGSSSDVPPPFNTGANTCWVRVSEGWAGRHWGSQFLPRVGQEVLVDFIDGDPDRPIITGRVYNADSGVTNLPFPSPETATKQLKEIFDLHNSTSSQFQRSGIKTRSTPKPDGAKDGFHLLRLDDSFGKEQFLLRSQKRLDIRAFGSTYETTSGSRFAHIGYKDADSDSQGGDFDITVGNDYQLHINGGHYERVEKDYNLTVVGQTVLDLESDAAFMVKGTAALNAAQIIMEAKQKISLKVGGNAIVIDPSGVTIVGTIVKINSGGSGDETPNPSIEDPVDAEKADPGDPPDFLARQPKAAGGGGRRRRQLNSQHYIGLPRPGEPPAVTALRNRLNNTPTGRAAMYVYDRDNVQPVIGAAGGGTFYTPPDGHGGGNTVTLDPTSQVPASDFVHEMNHADAQHSGLTPNINSSSRGDYVNGMLNEEAHGEVVGEKAHNELAAAGDPEPGTRNPFTGPVYDQASQQGAADYRAAHPDASQADVDAAGQAAGEQAVRNSFQSGNVTTSNTGQSYPQYYGSAWDGAHPPPPPGP